MRVDSFKREFSDDFCIGEESGKKGGGRMDRKKRSPEGQDDGEYKSKNLQAERRRREKLSQRLLELRSLVPNITNMTKETIITDAISYIEELQSNVKELSSQLLEIGSSSGEAEVKPESENGYEEKTDTPKEEGDMMDCGIEAEVLVAPISQNKLWIKVVCKNRKGAFTKLMEAMKVIGAQLNDTSATTSRGALLVTSTLELSQSGPEEAHKAEEFFKQIIKNL
ncbi:unnamed protein product [Cuscuta epithymum]|uniref:BHLH domain-containing protein n=1 Tax=Cuscuta epithymum TaxID=186058 RepID=A0AAV0G1H8_9ASTE|nr:unnamed protein product [Cuscuta epithymum]